MVTLAVTHDVVSFDAWKPVFDEHAAARDAHGVSWSLVLRGLEDGNHVVVLLDFPDDGAAQAFGADPSLGDAMQRGGVVGAPAVAPLVPVERVVDGDAPAGVTVAVAHRVGDFDTWKAVFDEHGAARRSHGQLAHRLWRRADDPSSVLVHVDFGTLDEARAFASDPSLPDAMERGGVEGPPTVTWLVPA